MASPAMPSSKQPTSDFRIYEFPSDYSVGTIVLVKRVPDVEANLKGEFLCAARGKVKVPRGKNLKFEPNSHFFQHPESLSKLPPDAFSFIDMRFSAMDDSEEKYVENAVNHILRFKSLRAVCFDRSDVTDEVAAKLAALPALECVTFASTAVSGKCMKSLRACKKLTYVRLGCAQIDTASIDYFSELPALRRLALMRTGLDNKQMKSVGKCVNLTNLDISHNSAIDDSAIPAFEKLTRIDSLNLKGTRISVKGLELFSKRGVVDIHLPLDFDAYSRADQIKLRKMFPHTKFERIASTTSEPDSEIIFAPTSRGRR